MLGAAKLVCQTSLFSAMTSVMLYFQLATVFQMAITLCDYMHTPGMVATLVKDFQKVLFSQPLVNQIPIGNISVNHLLVELPINPPIYGLPVSRILIG